MRRKLCAALWAAALAASRLLAMADGSTGAPPARIASWRVEKLLYRTDEQVRATATVTNVSDREQELVARAWLEWDIDSAATPDEKKLRLPPRSAGSALFVWRRPHAMFGHSARIELRQGQAVLDAAEDVFAASDHYWNTALIAAAGFLWSQFDNFVPKPDTKWAEDIVAQWRAQYFNGFEKFFWAPDDFAELTPEAEIWWSGQARYLETRKGLKALIDIAHSNGMKAITYAKLTGGGPTGAEIARRHPEWVWHSQGVLAVDRNARQLAEWDVTGEKHWGGWVAVNYNMNDPAVVDIGIRELCDSASMFGWDGARWDGNFDVRTEVWSLDGRLVERLNAQEADARNAANMARTKQFISKRHPRFVYGYNWTQGNWQQSMATNPKESVELCRGGGLIMNEYINHADGVQHPLHRWEDFARSLADDVEAVKELGGYYGPILGSPDNADGRYQNVFAYAAGAHPYYHHHWGWFMTRYGGLCWDEKLGRRHDAETLADVSTNVWWKLWIFDRPIDGGKMRRVFHLVNPPAQPVVGAGKKKEDIPAPIPQVEFVLKSRGLAGWKPVRAFRLSPEPFLKEKLTLETLDSGDVRVSGISNLSIWNIIVVDLAR